MTDEEALRLRQALDQNTSAHCALVEAIAAFAENQGRQSRGEAMAHNEDSIRDIIARHGLQGF